MLVAVALLAKARCVTRNMRASVSVEYALLAMLIAVAIVGSVALLGTELAGFFGPLLAAFLS